MVMSNKGFKELIEKLRKYPLQGDKERRVFIRKTYEPGDKVFPYRDD